jgi:tetratricopeptide (TPR) repeat protein
MTSAKKRTPDRHMTPLFKVTLIVAIFASLFQSALAADDLFSSQLVDQARYWQDKNRDDLAAESWRKLLLIDPKHPEALVKLGTLEARLGNRTEAENLYSRASQLPKSPSGLSALSTLLNPPKEAISLTPQPEVKVPSAPLEEVIKPKRVAKVKVPSLQKFIESPLPAKKIAKTLKIVLPPETTSPGARTSQVEQLTVSKQQLEDPLKSAKSNIRPCRLLPATPAPN